MDKKFVIRLIIYSFLAIALLILLVFAWGYIRFRIGETVDLSFANSVTVNHRSVYKSEDYETVKITDPEDVEALKRMCSAKGVGTMGGGGCGHTKVEMVFEGGSKTVALWPSNDDCDGMRLGERDVYYGIGEENREDLLKIMEKYGVVVSW